MEEYRQQLIVAEQKSQNDYDKAIVTLSGGALAISLVFIKDVIGNNNPIHIWAVIMAWSMWAISISSVVISFFLSRLSMRKAIDQTDNDDFSGGVGGIATKATQFFNGLSGLSFVFGIIFLIIFASYNFSNKPIKIERKVVMSEKKGNTPPPPPKPPPSKPTQPLTEGTIPPPPSSPVKKGK